MAKVWKPTDKEILLQWIAQLYEVSDKLTDWEARFVADMDIRLHRGSQLTQSQEEKLEEIYAEKTPL